jgi:hypothetical protein
VLMLSFLVITVCGTGLMCMLFCILFSAPFGSLLRPVKISTMWDQYLRPCSQEAMRPMTKLSPLFGKRPKCQQSP